MMRIVILSFYDIFIVLNTWFLVKMFGERRTICQWIHSFIHSSIYD